MDKIISKYLSGTISYQETIAMAWPEAREVCNKIGKIMEQRDRFLPGFKINSWLEQEKSSCAIFT